MIHYHLLLARKHGEVAGVPLLSSFSADTSAVTREYERLTSQPAVAEFGKTYAELLFVSAGVVLSNHDFPDPAQVAEQARRKALMEAKAIAAVLDGAKIEHENAKKRLDAAAAALKQLTPAQRRLLEEDAAAEKKAAAEAKAKTDAEERQRAQEAADAAARAAAIKAAADRAAARDTMIAELSSQSHEQLVASATAAKLEFDPAEPSDVLVLLLVKAAGLES